MESFELLHCIMKLLSKEGKFHFNAFYLEYEELADRIAANDQELIQKILDMEENNNAFKN